MVFAFFNYMDELTGPQLNVLGVQELVESDVNKREFGGPNNTPMQSGSELELNIEDGELIKLASKWENNYNQYYSKLKQKQDKNKSAWMGKDSEDGENKDTNLIFEAESTMEPQALSANPEPVVWSASDKPNDEKARAVKVMLQYHADTLNLKPKLGKMLRHWDLFYIGAIKHGFNTDVNDIKSNIIYPTNLIFDSKGYVDENMDFVGLYVGEKKNKTVGKLIELYPKMEKEIMVAFSGDMDKEVTFIEWWTDDYMFVTCSNLVLDKSKNPHFNYDDPKMNHFAKPCKPYTLLSIFSLGNQPHDNTTLVEQSLPNQLKITKRTKQIDKNISLSNNALALNGKFFNEDQAKQAANAREVGDPILVPDGVGDMSNAILTLDAPSLPTSTFNELEISKSDLRSIFGTAGLTPVQNDNDRTVRGKILDRNIDTSRIGGGVGEALERVADNIFNWWTQLYYVYYDEPHYASIIGSNKAVEYVTLSQQTLDTRIVVSVAPNSMKPKDEVTEQNFYTDLFMSDRVDPVTYFEKIGVADPMETAERTTLWMVDKGAYMMKFFGQDMPQQQGMPQPGQEMGIPSEDGTLSAPPPAADLSQVPLNS